MTTRESGTRPAAGGSAQFPKAARSPGRLLSRVDGVWSVPTLRTTTGTDRAGETKSRIARVSGVERTDKATDALDEALRLRAEQLVFRAKEAERQDRLTDALTLAEAAARIESKNPELFDRSESPQAYLEALEEHCRIAWDARGTAPAPKPEGSVAKPAARNLVAREQPARRPANAPREETATASLARNGRMPRNPWVPSL